MQRPCAFSGVQNLALKVCKHVCVSLHMYVGYKTRKGIMRGAEMLMGKGQGNTWAKKAGREGGAREQRWEVNENKAEWQTYMKPIALHAKLES